MGSGRPGTKKTALGETSSVASFGSAVLMNCTKRCISSRFAFVVAEVGAVRLAVGTVVVEDSLAVVMAGAAANRSNANLIREKVTITDLVVLEKGLKMLPKRRWLNTPRQVIVQRNVLARFNLDPSRSHDWTLAKEETEVGVHFDETAIAQRIRFEAEGFGKVGLHQ
jgi:hypothetical protein